MTPQLTHEVTPAGSGGFLGSPWLAALLTAVVVGLAVFTGFTLYDRIDAPQDASSVVATGPNDEERDAVLATAAELSQRVLTYHHDSFAEDLELARARLTPAFRDEYDAAMAQVRANTKRNKISQEATAVASSIVSATTDRATVLVFVNQETISARTRGNQLVRNRLVVDLVKVDDTWAMAGVNALG